MCCSAGNLSDLVRDLDLSPVLLAAYPVEEIESVVETVEASAAVAAAALKVTVAAAVFVADQTDPVNLAELVSPAVMAVQDGRSHEAAASVAAAVRQTVRWHYCLSPNLEQKEERRRKALGWIVAAAAVAAAAGTALSVLIMMQIATRPAVYLPTIMYLLTAMVRH